MYWDTRTSQLNHSQQVSGQNVGVKWSCNSAKPWNFKKSPSNTIQTLKLSVSGWQVWLKRSTLNCKDWSQSSMRKNVHSSSVYRFQPSQWLCFLFRINWTLWQIADNITSAAKVGVVTWLPAGWALRVGGLTFPGWALWSMAFQQQQRAAAELRICFGRTFRRESFLPQWIYWFPQEDA